MPFCYLYGIVIFCPVHCHIASRFHSLLQAFGEVCRFDLKPISLCMEDEAGVQDRPCKLFQLDKQCHKHPDDMIEHSAFFEVRDREVCLRKLCFYVFHFLFLVRNRYDLLHDVLIYHSTITSTPSLSMFIPYTVLLSFLLNVTRAL